MDPNNVTISILEVLALSSDQLVKDKISVMLDIFKLLDTNNTIIFKKINHMIRNLKEEKILYENYKQHKNVYIHIDSNFNNCLIENTRKSEWVYFIQEGDNGNIKIGLTNNLQKRIKTLQTGNSNILSLFAYIETNNMHELEKKFHKYFQYCRGSGEWFSIPNNLLIDTLIQYRSVGEQIFDTDTNIHHKVAIKHQLFNDFDVDKLYSIPEIPSNTNDVFIQNSTIMIHNNSHNSNTNDSINTHNTTNHTNHPNDPVHDFIQHIKENKPKWYTPGKNIDKEVLRTKYEEYSNTSISKLKFHNIFRNVLFVGGKRETINGKKILVVKLKKYEEL